jgi:XTP/dITP diphosphohydrolase
MKKIKEILIGTHNKGKIKEISYLLNKRIKKISPFELKIKSPAETGMSFQSNSELKARYFFQKSKMITISDDSGLCIECLDNKPGIYSARWAKKYGGFKQAMTKIIQLVKNKNKHNSKKNMNAKFVCSLTVYLGPKQKFTTIGEIAGKISNKILGKNGFGYDPIFIPIRYNLTFGQMRKKEKILMDHRFIAFKKLKKKIKIL